MFENPRGGRQARNFTTTVPKILDFKWSSEQIFSENCRWVPPEYLIESYLIFRSWPLNRLPRCHSHDLADIGNGGRKSVRSLLWHCLNLRLLFQMEFMRNEYKIFLLESIVLSAIFTACCSSGSNRFLQVWACRLKTVRARENPYISRPFGLKYLE